VVPEKIESTLTMGCPSIKECFVYGDGTRSHLVAVIMPAGEEGSDAGQLRTKIMREIQLVAKKEELKYYEVPRDLMLAREAFSEINGQRTITGKLNRRTLAEHYRDDIELMYQRTANQTRQTRDTIRAAIASTVLDRVDGGDADSTVRSPTVVFFRSYVTCSHVRCIVRVPQDEARHSSLLELGGDSLGAVNLMKIIREQFAVSMPLAMVLERPLDELADFVERHIGGEADASRRESSINGSTTIDWRSDSRLDAETQRLLRDKRRSSSQV
jgi:fatty acid CoA ligase FadD9